MRRHGAYDYEQRAEYAQATMTENVGAARAARTETPVGSRVASGQKIQLAEEELHAASSRSRRARVDVRKEVVTEHRTLDVPVQAVRRSSLSGGPRTASLPLPISRRGEQIRIPVMEEQVRVEKTAVVKEEVDVHKRTTQENKQVAGTVRKEELRVTEKGDVEVRETGKGKTPNEGKRK